MKEANQELIPDNEEKLMEKLFYSVGRNGMGWQNNNHILISFN